MFKLTRPQLSTIVITTCSFVGLVLYNYWIAQKAIKETRQSVRTIEMSTLPQTVTVGHFAPFSWRVIASPDQSTTSTTIYWSYQSSPSALTRTDSPQAVGYEHYQPDYLNGSFSLPGSFDLSIPMNRSGTVYYRAYSKVGDDHLWTPEMRFEVIK